MPTPSIVHSQIPRAAQRVSNFDIRKCEDPYKELHKFGLGLDNRAVKQMMSVMDSLQPDVTTPSIIVPLQFLQYFSPGFVNVLTWARNIDDFIGMSVVGNWYDEQIVQGVLESLGTAQPYGDYPNTNFSSFNINWNVSTVVRFIEGMQADILEQEHASAMRVDVISQKRMAAIQALEQIRNAIGFVGYNNGLNNTYGLLNAPGEPAYVTVANGASGFPQWSTKTTLEIESDILSAAAALRTQSGDRVDPEKVPMTLGIASASVDYLKTATTFNISVMTWLKDNFPKVRVVSAPELNAANGGANVFYLYADEINDGVSTDDYRTFAQMVPMKFRTLGVQQLVKGMMEGYSNAMAGVFCKRPSAVVRRSGI